MSTTVSERTINQDTKRATFKGKEEFSHPQIKDEIEKYINQHGKGPHDVVKIRSNTRGILLVTFIDKNKEEKEFSELWLNQS